jgi:esterase
VLIEPGGNLDVNLDAAAEATPSLASRIAISAEKVRAGGIEGALQNFFDDIEGGGAWARLSAAAKQQLRDNVYSFLGQINENRKPYTLSDAQAIRAPTLLIGGGATKGSLSVIWRVLAEHIAGARTAVIPNAGHWMFEQAPQEYCDVVMEFLAGKWPQTHTPFLTSPRLRGEGDLHSASLTPSTHPRAGGSRRSAGSRR